MFKCKSYGHTILLKVVVFNIKDHINSVDAMPLISAMRWHSHCVGICGSRSSGSFNVPPRGYSLCLRIKLVALLPVEVQIPEEAVSGASEGEERDRHWDRHIDSHLTHVHTSLEVSRGCSRRSEYSTPISISIRIHNRYGFIECVHTHT